MMKAREAETSLRKALEAVYDKGESAKLASLVMEAIGFIPAQFPARDELLTAEQIGLLSTYRERLLLQEPIQYILQKAWFYNLELYVDPAVLIPRPETEELVDWVVKDVQATHPSMSHKAATQADATTQLKILDIGTGSGCIALALKNALPKAEVWGCDVSDAALNVARRNGAALNIRVDFQGVDITDEAQQKSVPTTDIIISNPPYIPLADKSTMRTNVLAHEPHMALFVPDDDALLFYKTIARFGHKRLYPTGNIYVETHEALAQDVADLFKQEGYVAIEVRKDMQGKERMVKAHPDLPGGKAI